MDGVGGNRRLYETKHGQDSSEETFLRPPEIYVGAERYSERLEFIANVLLACVAFQYMIGESIPKLGILTTMDWLLMSSYITLFAMSLETMIVHHYSLDGSRKGMQLDWIGMILVPLLYLLMQSFHILTAVFKRRVHLAKWRGQAGVNPNMLRSNVVSAERIKNHGATKKMKKFEMETSIENSIETVVGVREEAIAQTHQMREEQLELQTVEELCFGLTMFGGNDMSGDNGGDIDEGGGLRERRRAGSGSGSGSGGEASSSKYTVSANDDGAEMVCNS